MSHRVNYTGVQDSFNEELIQGLNVRENELYGICYMDGQARGSANPPERQDDHALGKNLLLEI